MNDRCAVVILNWNNLEDTVDCITSVLNSDYPNFEIIVTDNGYDSSYPQILRKLFPQIVVVENKKNLGFAEGNNTGIRVALERGADYVFMLNNDTLISKMAIRNLVNVFKSDPQIGVVGAVTWEYVIPNQYQNCGGSFNTVTGKLKWFSRVTEDFKAVGNTVELDFVYGSAMCVRREMAEKIGLFNADYFLYFEDIEWCYRAKIKGWRIVVGLDVFVWHKMGSLEFGNIIRPLSYYYYIRNQNYFIKTYGSFRAKLQRSLDNIRLCLEMQFLLWKASIYRQKDTPSHYAILHGIVDFYLHRKGEQNTWKLDNWNDDLGKTVELQIEKSSRNDRKFRVFVPLQDQATPQLESTADWLIPLARKFPHVEFVLWIHPCNMVDENKAIEQNSDLFSVGWLMPELWHPDLTVRWMQEKASLHLTGIQINRMVMNVRPKIPRFEALLVKIFSHFPIRGIHSTIFVNDNKVKDIRLRNLDFQKVEIDFPPTDLARISVCSDKSCRYGLSNNKRISLAVSHIEYFYKNGHNQLASKTLSLAPASITSTAADNLINKLEKLSNIKLPSPEALRKIDTLCSSMDSMLLCSMEQNKPQWGTLLACCRKGIPVIATQEALGNLPLVDKRELLISTKENIENALQSLLQSDELKTNLSANLRKSLDQYFGVLSR